MFNKIYEYYPLVMAIMHSLNIEEIIIEDKDMNLVDNENILITRDLKNNNIKIVLRRS